MDGSLAYDGMFGGDAPRTVSIDRACRIFRVSRRTLYYWIKDGRLQTKRTVLGSQRVLIDSVKAMSSHRS